MSFLRFTATPIRRIEGDKNVSENDIFNPKYWIEDIVFPILKELSSRPAAASGNFCLPNSKN